MNIETANRLYELRKKSNLSQEELADKLGISRQAISKWERAEASPDTDNLILLAKLYGVTLDELLNSEEAISEVNELNEAKKDSITIEDNKAIITDDEGQSLVIENGKFKAYDKDGKEVERKNHVIDSIITGIVALMATIAYLVLGFTVNNGFRNYWVLFLLIPIAGSICECIRLKRFSSFAYPILITMIFCFLGMKFSLWHPYWVLFITIPLFYIITNSIDKYVLKTKPINDKDEK